jgi:hypothetical protein
MKCRAKMFAEEDLDLRMPDLYVNASEWLDNEAILSVGVITHRHF